MKKKEKKQLINFFRYTAFIVFVSAGLTSCPDKLLSTLEDELNASYIQSTVTFKTNNFSAGEIVFPETEELQATFGSSFNISASEPKLRGYYFSGWTYSGSGRAVFQNSESLNTSVSVYDGNVEIQANYSPITASLEYLGQYDLFLFDHYNDRIADPRDLVFLNGYIYVVGQSDQGNPRLIKIDVSESEFPCFTDSVDLISGSSSEAVQIITYGTSTLNIAEKNGNILKITNTNTLKDSIAFIMSVNEYSITSDSMGYFWWLENNNNLVRCNNSNLAAPDNILKNICYSDISDCLFVSGCSSDNHGSLSSIIKISPTSIATQKTLDIIADYGENLLPTKMTYKNGTEYLYSIAENKALITFDIENAPADFSVNTTADINADTTGSTMKDIDYSGNYLITAGTNTSSQSYNGWDRFCIYDIHENNGSAADPYYLNNAPSRGSGNNDVIAIDFNGEYLYTLEGTALKIYKFTASAE